MKTKKKTQSERILEHLQSGGTLSQREAAIYLDCYRLAARIHDLRLKGHKIKNTMTHSPKDSMVLYAVYSMDQD